MELINKVKTTTDIYRFTVDESLNDLGQTTTVLLHFESGELTKVEKFGVDEDILNYEKIWMLNELIVKAIKDIKTDNPY